jgi:predicted PurR-regulated permease PerM
VALLDEMSNDFDRLPITHESRPIYYSYIFFAATIILVAWLHLATPLLTVLFCYFLIKKLYITRSKTLALLLFFFVTILSFYAFVIFVRHALKGLPEIAETSIPKVMAYAEQHQIELPFDDDLNSVKAWVMEKIRHQVGYLGNFAKLATKEFVFLLIGVIVACSLFLNPAMDLEKGRHRLRNNLYTFTTDQIVMRFHSFYKSFETVMSAQIIIAAINTAFTAIFTLAIHLPNAYIVIGVTFLCGLLPIIGNIISNAVITAIAFTISPQLAISALIFLIVLHKFEYFLNSKIIGTRINNPVWLTLLGLILAERLMGVPGIVLAPVILHFIKVESSQVEVRALPDRRVAEVTTSTQE